MEPAGVQGITLDNQVIFLTLSGAEGCLRVPKEAPPARE